jgi:nucleoside-diphosphate-sugar epimerase
LIADITRPDELARLPDGFDWVVNCVASRGGGAEDYRRIYLQGTRHLLDWLSAKPPQKFVYTSSTSVYGQTDGSWVKETSPTEPLSKTAKVLLETERLLLAAVADRKVPTVILRVAGIYGPERGHGFKQFLKNEARMKGDGSRFLNMIHRDDVIGCIIAALKNSRAGEVYNVVDDEPVSQMDFFLWLAEELGKKLPPTVPEDYGEDRKRGVTNKRVSNRKLKMEFGHQFKYPNFRIGYTEEISRMEQAGELPE